MSDGFVARTLRSISYSFTQHRRPVQGGTHGLHNQIGSSFLSRQPLLKYAPPQKFKKKKTKHFFKYKEKETVNRAGIP